MLGKVNFSIPGLKANNNDGRVNFGKVCIVSEPCNVADKDAFIKVSRNFARAVNENLGTKKDSDEFVKAVKDSFEYTEAVKKDPSKAIKKDPEAAKKGIQVKIASAYITEMTDNGEYSTIRYLTSLQSNPDKPNPEKQKKDDEFMAKAAQEFFKNKNIKVDIYTLDDNQLKDIISKDDLYDYLIDLQKKSGKIPE